MKRKSFPLVIFWILTLLAGSCQSREKAEAYTAEWVSMKQFQVPEWFRDAKFGIYCHWGVYSVPAYKTEWHSLRSPG